MLQQGTKTVLVTGHAKSPEFGIIEPGKRTFPTRYADQLIRQKLATEIPKEVPETPKKRAE